jgi:hypothetical protein
MELKDRTGTVGFVSVVADGAGAGAGCTMSTWSCSPARKEKGFFLVSVVVVNVFAAAGAPMVANERVWFAGATELVAASLAVAVVAFFVDVDFFSSSTLVAAGAEVSLLRDHLR